MKLYYAPGTIASVVAITLEELGLAYEAVKVDFKAGEQTQAPYKEINPKGRVPALETEHGILTEVGAIIEHLADQAPQKGLKPENLFDLARMREVMFYLASTMHVNHAHRFRGARWAKSEESHKDMRAMVPETMAASCGFIEEYALRGPYVLGDRFSLADPYLYVVSGWAEPDGVDMAPFPKLSDFRKSMEDRASVQNVRAAGFFG